MAAEAAELRRLRRAVRRDPAGPDALRLAEHLASAERLDEAIEVLERCDEVRPVRSARNMRVRLLAQAGRLGEALEGCEALLQQDSDNVALASLKMELLVAAGDRVRARLQLGALHSLGVPPERVQEWSNALAELERGRNSPGGTGEDVFLSPSMAGRFEARGHTGAARRAWAALAAEPEHAAQAEVALRRLDSAPMSLPGRAAVEAVLRDEAGPARASVALQKRLVALLDVWEECP